MQITVDLPGEFAAELARVGPSDLSEILTLGLSEWRARFGPEFAGLGGLLERLAALPKPEDVLQLRPSAELAARARDLVEKSRNGQLNDKEEVEWQRLELAEHLVRIAKAEAASQLAKS
jgi:hypothetical protein